MSRSGSTGDACTCGQHGCAANDLRQLTTLANLLTLARLVGTCTLAGIAIQRKDQTLLLWALGIYWVGDSLDGAAARLLDHETVAGGVFDILSDRISCALFYTGWAWMHKDMILPVILYLVHFMVFDNQLSLSFKDWNLRSPNYFNLVDRTVWLLNFSTPAKVLNGTVTAAAIVLLQSAGVASALICCLATIKIWSLIRLHRLGKPRMPCATK